MAATPVIFRYSELDPQESALGRLKGENEGMWEFLTEDNSLVCKPTVLLYNPPWQVRRFIIPSLFFPHYSITHFM